MNHRPATTEELLSHADWVRRLSRALLSDPNEAEDVAQDAWVAALKRPPTAGTGMRAWWARVVRNSASNRRRSEQRRTDRERIVATERTESGDPQVETTLEAHRRLASAIDALDGTSRDVIVEHYFHGASSREIAAREHVADSTVRTRLQKALEKLRRELDLRAGGDRKAWAALLAPIARLERAAVPAVLIASWIKVAASVALVGLAGAVAYEVLLPRSEPVEIAVVPPLVSPPASEPLSAPAAATPREESPPALAAAAPSAPSSEPLARVDARVLDAHGLPIQGARLRFVDRSSTKECTDEEAPQSLSDSGGRVSLSIRAADRSRRRATRGGLPAGSWDGSFEVTARGFATRALQLTIVLGETSVLGDIVLVAGADLSGRCLASDGTPIAGTRVSLMLPDLSLEDRAQARSGSFGRSGRLRSAKCAADGSFLLSGVPVGCFRVYAVADGRSAAFSEPFQLSPSEQRVLPDLLLEECPVAIRGKVLEQDGSPCAGARIEYTFGAEGEFVGARAEQDGTFSLAGISTATVDIYARRAKDESGEAQLLGARPGESGLVLTLPAPRAFEVRVEDPSGVPVERYSLGIHCMDGTGGGGTISALEGVSSQVARARPFVVRVEVDGFAPLEQGPFTQADVPAQLAFRLIESASVSGRILRAGVPEKWMEVHLAPELDQPRIRTDGMPTHAERGISTSSREDGTFAIAAGRSGRFLLWGEGRNGSVVFARSVELAVGHPLAELRIELAECGTIVGRVETTLETRARAAQVLLSSGVGEPRSERIAPDGSFRIEGLVPGSWWLRVAPDASTSSELLPAGALVEDALLKRIEVLAGETARCEFDARGTDSRWIEGRVLLGGAAPAAWTATLAPGERWWDAHRTAALVSADGSYRLKPSTFGPQILSLRSPGTPARDDVIEVHLLVPAQGQHWSLACELGGLDVEGEPGARVQLVADLPNGATWTTRAILDASGRAVLDALPAVKFRVSLAGSKDSPVEIEIRAGATVASRLARSASR